VNRFRINYIKFPAKNKTCLNLNVGYHKEISLADKRKENFLAYKLILT